MSRLRKILRENGIQPRKSLGQSFLEDENIIQEIVRTAHIEGEDTVVEIGAGVGLLTEAIAARAKRVVAVEIDKLLVQVLEGRLRSLTNIEIVSADILKCNLKTLAGSALGEKRVKIIGNIPYHISSPILFEMLAARELISTMTLMFQKEVADRLLAHPGTKAYGILTVLMDMYADMNQEMDVPPECFFPPPRITSTVVTFRMREGKKYDVRNENAFFPLIKAAFAHRRKTIFNNLRHTAWLGLTEEDLRKRLGSAGIDGQRRAETITTQEYALLTDVLTEK